MSYIENPTDMRTIALSVCLKCGTIDNSGKTSCCGRGGSWFENCGGVGNKKLSHTWYEGIQACQARSQSMTVIGQQLHAAQQQGIDPTQGADIANYEAVTTACKSFSFTPVSTLTPMPDTYKPDNVSITMSIHTLVTKTSTNALMTSSTHTSSGTRGCVNLLEIAVHTVVFWVCLLL